MDKRNGHKMAAGLCLLAALSLASGCGSKAEQETTATSALAEETMTAAETAEMETETEAEEPATEAERETAAEDAAEAEAEAAADAETAETYPGTLAAAEGEEQAYFGVMYASVLDLWQDGDGVNIYSLQDSNDPENIWTVSGLDIGLVDTELEKGSQAAFLFSGDMARDPEQVVLVAAVPYTAYRLGRAEGTTDNNMMSTFSIRTDSGEQISFLKDGCRIEEGAMSRNEGDRVIVYYAYSQENAVYYPLEVRAAE